ncbi:MAG TPA: chitobiase/beta-hexosaminidase C-terminal domain-containing protein, partial [Candidatus Wallbacteria bacterium]|nr:chitobiase/beta-hexosaminidase C-terminal domain-containing protein [Candidatus Wallbacteria bacterium]
MPAYSDIPSSVSLIKISGIAVDESTTAKTLIAIEKNIIPDTPVIGISSSDISNGTITKDFSSTGTLFNSALESRIGDSALITEMSRAVKTVATVMTSSAVNPTIKEMLSSSQQMSATGMLTTFSNIVKTTENTVSALVTSMQLPTSVTISNTTINSQTPSETITSVVSVIQPKPADTTPPVLTMVSIAPSSVAAGGVITINFTAGEALAGVPTVTLLGRTASVTQNSSVSFTAAITVSASDDNPVTFVIANIFDAAGNRAQNVTATTDSSAVTIIKAGVQTVADPVFSPAAGNFDAAQTVTITCATEGASIKYTLDGSTPSASNGLTY